MNQTVSKGSPLPLASLRLLAPPFQLLKASMWQALKKQDVRSYWKVADFVSLVTDMVPELLLCKHSTQLNLGLRARYILELCRRELEEDDFILSHLHKIELKDTALADMKEEDKVTAHFLKLIPVLLTDPEERHIFFSEVFPAHYGQQYDSDLQALFWEFLCRLTQLLPVPDLEQTVCWLAPEGCLVLDCVLDSIDITTLLQHHKGLGHLEQHVPPSSMGDNILSSLSAAAPCCTTEPKEHNRQINITVDSQTILMDEVEIITVTDYAEVELGASADIELMLEENSNESSVNRSTREVSSSKQDGETRSENDVMEIGKELTQTIPQSGLMSGIQSEVNKDMSFQPEIPLGPHDCPDCEKKFKFASSLTAHRVIHTGERPHCCMDCGRCFSFRQSLDRHRNTHKTRRLYDCAICGQTFHSLSARTEHKQAHKQNGIFTCQQCKKKFKWEVALARHLKTHMDNLNKNAAVCEKKMVATVPDSQQVYDSCDSENKDVCKDQSTLVVPEHTSEVISQLKVRTSSRKRKPTMKVQVINLQNCKSSGRQKKVTRLSPAALKCVPFNCSAEHSYGSSIVSSKDGDGSCVADCSSTAFSCPECPFHHVEEMQVQLHIQKAHFAWTEDKSLPLQPITDGEGRFSCLSCDKSFKFQSLLKAHQHIHTGEQPFICSQCGRCFSFKQSLERHKQTHKSGRKYECTICGQCFKSLLAQREHKNTHMENGEYLCSECGRTFTWKSALMRHLKTHSEDADKAERSYKCPRCDLGFSMASYLSKHLQTHQEERSHSCNCGKSFAYRAALTAHQRIHQKERPHICTLCGKGFLYKGGLLSHMKIHSEEMPFMCSYCGKCFKREPNMKKHERFHTRENVFSCSQCDKSFVYKATLTRHELTHSGERPYLCSDCGKGFFSHAELLKHERFHTGHKPFQCPHCDKKFTQSCYLTIHLRYHTGVRPYSCTQCEKSFLSANRLKRHQQTHTGEKPYLCGECGKGFRQSYHLKMHQRTHVIKLK